MLFEMVGDKGFIEKMSENDFYIDGSSLTMIAPTPEELGEPFSDNYILKVKHSKIWKSGLLPIYEYYKEHGEINSNLLENLYQILWKKYRKFAKFYSGRI